MLTAYFIGGPIGLQKEAVQSLITERRHRVFKPLLLNDHLSNKELNKTVETEDHVYDLHYKCRSLDELIGVYIYRGIVE